MRFSPVNMAEVSDSEYDHCVECNATMDCTDHNYGREDAPCCIHCWNLAQMDFEDEQRQEKAELKQIWKDELNRQNPLS